jgi:hypothetical protein
MKTKDILLAAMLTGISAFAVTNRAPGPFYTIDMHRYGITNASYIQGSTGKFQYLEVDSNLVRGTVLFARTGHYEVVYVGTNAAYESNMWRLISWTEATGTFVLRSGGYTYGALYATNPASATTRAGISGYTQINAETGAYAAAVVLTASDGGIVYLSAMTGTNVVLCGGFGYDGIPVVLGGIALPKTSNDATSKVYVDSKILSSSTNGTGITQSPYYMPATGWTYYIKYVVEEHSITNSQIGITFSGGITNTAGSFDKFTIAYYEVTNGYGHPSGLGIYDNASQIGLGALNVGPCSSTNHAANKGYVDSTFVSKSGDWISGDVFITNFKTLVVCGQSIAQSNRVVISGDTNAMGMRFTLETGTQELIGWRDRRLGVWDMYNGEPTNWICALPTLAEHAATKAYTDACTNSVFATLLPGGGITRNCTNMGDSARITNVYCYYMGSVTGFYVIP